MSRHEQPLRSSRAWLARFIPGTGSRFSKDLLICVYARESTVEGSEVAVHRSAGGDHDEPEHCPARGVEQRLPVVARSWTTFSQVLPRSAQFRYGPERDRGEWFTEIRYRRFACHARNDEQRNRNHLRQHLELPHF